MRKVKLYPSQSNTGAHILQTDQGLVAACNHCSSTIKDTGLGADGIMYWRCARCNITFDHAPIMANVTFMAPIPDPNDYLKKSGFTYKRWVEAWTGLTVEVTIDA